jgi:hypothetical protein
MNLQRAIILEWHIKNPLVMQKLKMIKHGKMWPVETIPGMGPGEWKRMMAGVNSSMIYLIYHKNFYKYNNVHPA